MIIVIFKKGTITCEARKKIGWVRKDIDFKYQGEEFKIAINPYFLSQVLEKATTMKTNESLSLFLSGEFRHAIALWAGADDVDVGYEENDEDKPDYAKDDDIPF